MNTPKFEDRYTRIGGSNTRYWQAGTQGSAVLLLHGIGCSVLEWQPNLAVLAAHHRVFVIDLLGFGRTDKPANASYTIPQLAQFALDFLTAQGIEQAHFAGNSMGGRIAIECARMAPARVASQVLVAPAGIDRQGALFEFRLATLPLIGEAFTWPNPIGTRMLWRKAFADPSFVTEQLVKDKVALARLPGAQTAFLKTLRNVLEFGGFPADQVSALHATLPKIKTPTLVIWGQQDQFVNVAHAEVLRRLLPNVQVQVWDRCGHAPQIECAERFNQAALDFWGSLQTGVSHA